MGAVLNAAESAPVTDWGPRLLLTGAVLAIIGLAVWGMLRGWRRRAGSQEDIPALAAPPEQALAAATDRSVPGLYVATTSGGDLLDRIVAQGLGHRGRARLSTSDAGVLIQRSGETDVWIPRPALRDVRLGSGQAQKAFEAGGLILVTWRLGARTVDTGFRADDPDQHVATAEALSALVPTPGGPR